jgi:hypothetical protein
MGLNQSILVEPYLEQAKLLATDGEYDIINELSVRPVVSYGVMMTAFDNQVLKFEKVVDIVNSFDCLTEGIKLDVLIDGKIHYGDIKDLTLVLLGCQMNTITLRTYTDRPVILTCRGYTLREDLYNQIATRKVKTKTTRYHRGNATKINAR